jgi:hypothetical protein
MLLDCSHGLHISSSVVSVYVTLTESSDELGKRTEKSTLRFDCYRKQ